MNNFCKSNITAEETMGKIKEKKKQENRQLKEIIKNILSNCLRNIQLQAEKNENDIIFEVPTFTHSKIYTPEIALEKIAEELNKNNFKTYIINDKQIFISWEHIFN